MRKNEDGKEIMKSNKYTHTNEIINQTHLFPFLMPTDYLDLKEIRCVVGALNFAVFAPWVVVVVDRRAPRANFDFSTRRACNAGGVPAAAAPVPVSILQLEMWLELSTFLTGEQDSQEVRTSRSLVTGTYSRLFLFGF